MKKLIFIVLIFCLVTPVIQEKCKIFKLRELDGVEITTVKPEFSWSSWMKGDFQNQFNEYTDENFGLRNFFIRFYNQLDFSIFSKTHADVIVGKKGYLFQSSYTNEIIGKDFEGDSAMDVRIKKLKRIQDYLERKNTLLVTIEAPCKSDYFKEYLPDYYKNKATDRRNYNLLNKYAAKENINIIDLNKWVLQLKDTSRYPLFPQRGIHWSYYCMALCADSIKKYIEIEKNIHLRNFSWTLDVSDSLRGTDYDLGNLLNIYRKLPSDAMAYPKYSFGNEDGVSKPKILVIADSFYWTVFNDGIFKNIFGKETFFYYLASVFPQENAQSGNVADLNLLKEVEDYDVVLLLQSSGNYGKPGLGFIEAMDFEFNKREQMTVTEKYFITQNPKQLAYAQHLADSIHVSIDSAKTIYANQRVENYFNGVSNIKIQMRRNPGWMQSLYAKAFEQKLPVDKIMQQDAEWMYVTDNMGK